MQESGPAPRRARRALRVTLATIVAVGAVVLIRQWRFAVNERREPLRPPGQA